MYGRDQVITLLINHQSFNSINEKDKYGQTALHYCEYLIILKLIILFILLFKASQGGHDQGVYLLINHPKCNLNDKNIVGHTALHLGEFLNIFSNNYFIHFIF